MAKIIKNKVRAWKYYSIAFKTENECAPLCKGIHADKLEAMTTFKIHKFAITDNINLSPIT